MKGIYLCPTPIGNLEDISLRTLKVLENVDIIACEDTRVSKLLLDHYNIKKPLISYHKFNYMSQIPHILENLKEDKAYAFISDAGMPGISDPGTEILQACIEENIPVNVLPGASASLVALVLSGLDTERFTFIGFVPEKSSQRKKELENLKTYKETLIFYEAPHRIHKFLLDLYEVFGDRKVSISRELTKYYEETIRKNLSQIIENKDLIKAKGEFVVVVQGYQEEEADIDIEGQLKELLDQGLTKKDAVKEVAKKFNLKKNLVYEKSLDL
ncbi:MAG: 16S rRNA (cytidine(1402)-2'-O)-methyltransferase [Bacillota bacterium]|nr:16S rRNA (cytidine(1402)-2'-O)-methyltransferase [Bacillota bacterium]